MLAGVMALVGVVVGAALCLTAGAVSERRRDRRHAHRQAIATKQACYQRTLLGLDELLTMRPDHPDIGLALRTATANITELRLIAPSHTAELADMCVQAAMQSAGDPTHAAQLRAHFVDAVRGDLLEVGTVRPPRIALPVALPLRRDSARQARHAKARRA